MEGNLLLSECNCNGRAFSTRYAETLSITREAAKRRLKVAVCQLNILSILIGI
jgi:hypothetical protein